MKQAYDWFDTAANRFEAARLLCKEWCLNETLDVIAPSLIGSCFNHKDLPSRNIPSYNQFLSGNKGSIKQPQPIRCKWLVEYMLRAGQLSCQIDSSLLVSRVFIVDIYQQMEQAKAELVKHNSNNKTLMAL